MNEPNDLFEVLSQVHAGRTSCREQVEFEIEFYSRVLAHGASHIDSLKRLVELYSCQEDYARAQPLYDRLVRLRPADYIARYNLACNLSMLNRVDDALQALEQALDLGYHDTAHMEADSDLDNLRERPAYIQLMRRHGLAG